MRTPQDYEPHFSDYDDGIPMVEFYDALPVDPWGEFIKTFVTYLIWKLKHYTRKG